jgi:hypothetical protein
MKKVIISFLSFTVLPLSAFADCRVLAEQAALNFARSTSKATIAWDIGGSRLKQHSGSTLIYEVEMRPSYSDGGSSDEFPPEIFVVRANGTTKVCKVTGVKSK